MCISHSGIPITHYDNIAVLYQTISVDCERFWRHYTLNTLVYRREAEEKDISSALHYGPDESEYAVLVNARADQCRSIQKAAIFKVPNKL